MATQPKPPPKPEPPKPGQPQPRPAAQAAEPGHPATPPSQPPNQPHPGSPPKPEGEEDDDRDESDKSTLDRLKGRDKTGQIPGTPLTPPEGHSWREPAPGEPGGPSGGGGTDADEPVRTAADEQRERSAEYQDKGVETVKAEHDERTEDEKRSRPVPGVSHRPVEPHETSYR